MPSLVHIDASWVESKKSMHVTLEAGGEKFIEKMDRVQWNKFIINLKEGNGLMLGGVAVRLRGPAKLTNATYNAIKTYLFKVDEALRVSGSTEFLRGER